MSPRNDTYLTLCLAQAELSPLHYRHGSIIVRGGKVIGQGFNCYRPGFDGGALKTGTLARNPLDGAAIAELKQRLKSKHKPDLNAKSKNQQDSGSFTPFELTGLGHNSNACLSMHSEMMAIQSALSLSSGTLSSQTSAQSGEPEQEASELTPKPYARLSSQALATPLFKSSVLNRIHLNQVFKEYNDNNSGSEEGSNSFHDEDKKDMTANTLSSAKKDYTMKYGYPYQYQQPDYHYKAQQKPYAHKRRSEPPLSISSLENMNSITSKSPSGTPAGLSNSRTTKPKNTKKSLHHASPRPILVTKKETLNSKPSIAARTKDLRLKGSDIYVARLGSTNLIPSLLKQTPKSIATSKLATPEKPSKQETGSLYDELSHISRTSSSPNSATPLIQATYFRPEVRASRPCYRCVSAMHAVGIKRVFWTNQDGDWESAKVRDLVEALERGGQGGWNDEGQVDRGVFVTKHEVLLLRRLEGL